MPKFNRRCQLIIDSCCDLPAELVDSFNVDVISFNFIMDDGDHLDDLWRSLTPKEFYGRLRKGEIATTAQVPLIELGNAFQLAIEKGIPAVYIGFSSALSGTLDAATLIAEELVAANPGSELYVVDSKLASLALGLFVIEAVRQLDRGLTAKELVAWAQEARYFVNGFFTLGDLETLRRGGRIPDMAAIAGSKLDIKPILTIDSDGALAFFGAARGRKKAIRQLLAIYQDRNSDTDLNTVIVGGADADKERAAIVQQVIKLPKEVAIWEANIGPVIGSHVGPEMLAIVFWGRDRRDSLSIADRIANKVTGRSH